MKKKIIAILSIPIFIVFLLNRAFFFNKGFLENIASYAIYPVLELSHILAKPFKSSFVSHRETDKTENIALSDENEILREENIKLKALIAYSRKSKELKEFEERYQLENTTLATVLARTLTKCEHTLIVNKGSRNGIVKDMVALYKLQLVGRVSEVFPEYSKITLITDKQSKVAAYANTSGAKGIVEGENIINRCYLKYISHLKTLNNGDFILSSGNGLVFPEGFCLGKIINLKMGELCYHVEVEPLIDLENLEVCHLTNQTKMNLL